MPNNSTISNNSTTPLLHITDLSIAAGRSRVVDGASFDLHSTEFVALVGASGSGKTLTALAAIGLLPVGVRIVGGSIRLRGEELLSLEEKGWQKVRGRKIAMIFQEPMTSLNPVMPVGKQIAEAVKLHTDCSHAEAISHAEEALRAVQISEPKLRLRSYPHQLSGGLRQRAMIAMALGCGPELLIADEPTTALDVTIQAGIIELLKKLQHDKGLAILLITHDIALAAEAVDRIVVMESGRIVEVGPSREIVENPRHEYTKQMIEHCTRREHTVSYNNC